VSINDKLPLFSLCPLSLVWFVFHSFLNQTSTVVFIDSAVDDYQALQTGLIKGVESVIISPNRDGIIE
ncbi:MAG: DUF4347 domain-containing protein, partial [Sphaerospermopsis kisseleviana]